MLTLTEMRSIAGSTLFTTSVLGFAAYGVAGLLLHLVGLNGTPPGRLPVIAAVCGATALAGWLVGGARKPPAKLLLTWSLFVIGLCAGIVPLIYARWAEFTAAQIALIVPCSTGFILLLVWLLRLPVEPLAEAPVQLMALERSFRFQVRVRRRLKPSLLVIDDAGLHVLRGEEPQEDAVLRGRPRFDVPWSLVRDVHFNRWFSAAIRVRFHEPVEGTSGCRIQWMQDSAVQPYDPEMTRRIYEGLRHHAPTAIGSTPGTA